MKITYDSWYDRHENRYISMQQGNVLIQIQMHKRGKMTCYIRIDVSSGEMASFTKFYLNSIKETKQFIKKTYEAYKPLYKLGKN